MHGARGAGGADGTVGDAVPPARAASAPSTGRTGRTGIDIGIGTGTDTDIGTCTTTGTGTGTGTRVTAPRPDTAGGAAEEGRSSGRFLARAALVTAVLSVAGSVLGLARDQALARLFGAGSETDAFLVAWTVPEFAATLLIEDGLAFALVPMFSLALARRAQGAPGDPVRALVASTLPRLALAFAAAGALVAVAAPVLVRALAPGLPDHALAVDCTRLTATCVVSFGLAGYCSAALRAHRRFLAPAAIYVAYNTGIITAMFLLGGRWGVRSAAVGVAVGGVLMVAAQLPALLGRLRRRDGGPDTPGTTPGTPPPSTPPDTRPPSLPPDTPPPSTPPDTRPSSTPASPADGARPLALALFGTVLLFALCRQSQVLIERFLASGLPSGAISHLNYAQKVAQIPMTLSLMLCTVTFPVVARALADGDTERARDRVERDVALAACLVLLGAATVVACAPQIIHLLFQRGAFTAADTAATAGVMRVYALGLLGQTVVGALARSYFSAGRASWYPFGAMAVGVVATAVVGARAVGPWGVTGIAAANAVGITVTAALLLAGMGPRSVPVRIRRVLGDLGRPVLAAAVATGAGALAAARVTGASGASGVSGAAADGAQAGLPLAVGAATVGGVFVALCLVLGVRGLGTALAPVRPARFLHPVTRRHPHGRFRFRFPFRDHR
ncbi:MULTISPECIES: murein biosynthesis integral membrane protein MurJ [unclassified Streptomyces]|uniref:murein biosynthesis integral membrane protein MurJ n=1 Tax=unclassified Streptomyces TaxID=2593676 RepID=UPI001FFCF944|nr:MULTISPECIES: lipid II flippase MurJ [unclassified Streptomyces]